MTEVSPTSTRAFLRQPAASPAPEASAPARQSTPLRRGEDRFEISDAGVTRMARASADPAIRQDLVERVRSEISAGTYETEDKLELAIDRLAGEIDLIA